MSCRVLAIVVAVFVIAPVDGAAASSISVRSIPIGLIPVPGGPDLSGEGVIVSYVADPGEVNDVAVTVTNDTFSFTDPGATISALDCTVSPDGHSAVCPYRTGFALEYDVDVFAGDRDDSVTVDWPAGVASTPWTSPGAFLDGGPGDDHLTGGAENDAFAGRDGDDQLAGGAGSDVFRHDQGADLISGGVGSDGFTASYTDDLRPAFDGVTVSLDGIANDGNAIDGAGDNVLPDVEDVVGTNGADTLVGDDDDNYLGGTSGADTLVGGGGDDDLAPGWYADVGDGDRILGGAGSDTADYALDRGPFSLSLNGAPDDARNDSIAGDVENLIGSQGPDTLTGDAGPNTLSAGDGNDVVLGGSGDDLLEGENGADVLTGGAGRDRAFGGILDDTLELRDGEADLADCGFGTDVVRADAIDALVNCEPDPSPATAAPDRAGPAVSLHFRRKPRHIRTLLRRGLLVSFACSEPCTILADLRRGATRVGRATRGLIGAGTVHLRVRGAQRRRLAALTRTRLTLRLVATDFVGNRRILTRRLTLRR
jgi:Ca2+-binding RTX toxin-like protein